MATIEEAYKKDLAYKSDFVLSSTGDFDTISGLENMKQALFNRLVTSPGSLIHRPNYGVGIKDFQNSPSTLSTQRQLALRIQEQFELDPRVEKVTGVQVNFDTLTPEKSIIIVKVKLQGYDEEAMKFIPFGEG